MLSRCPMRHLVLLAVTMAVSPAWSMADNFSGNPTPATGENSILQPVATTHPVTISLGDSLQKDDNDSSSKASCDCGKGKACGCEKQALNKAAAAAYKNPFYNNNFDYLCDPCYSDWHLGENLKRLCVGGFATVDVGGQYRARVHNERNMRGLGLTGRDDDFLLHRTRVYVNAELGNRVRFYGEMLDAVSNFENFHPRPIEENRFDVQNLLVDVVALDTCSGKLTARVGRQELLFGAQRVVSPLDWANTRRTFDGINFLWRGKNWDVDGFAARPALRTPAYLRKLDPTNDDVDLYGLYSTYKGLCCDKVDLYWLALDNNIKGFNYDMLGARYYGDRGRWLYELEGGVQFGENSDGSDHSAGALTGGLGYKFCRPWKPTLWAYYDWASGDNTIPNDASTFGNGYDHYFPLAHKYLGFMDFYGRRNIQDANLLFTVQPTKKLKLLAWYHYFRLANINDATYTVVMTPVSLNPSGSRDLGQELDLRASYNISTRTNLTLGYSHFFTGNYYSTTAGLPTSADADFVYTQFTVNF